MKKITVKARAKKRPGVGVRIIEGLEEAIAWSKGEEVGVRVTQVQIPDVDVSEVRHRMGLSQSQFATEIRVPASNIAKLGAGAIPPGCAHTSAVGRNRKAPRERRRRPEGHSMTEANCGQSYG